MNHLAFSLPNMLLESGSRLAVINRHENNPRRRPRFFQGEDHMALFPTWVKNALAKYQYRTVELSRKRTEENALRAILLAEPPESNKTSRKSTPDLAAIFQMTDFFLRE